MADLFDRGRAQTLSKNVPTGTAEPLATDTTLVFPLGYWVTAPASNSDPVYLCAEGDAAGDGLPLEPEARAFITRDRPSLQHCIASVPGQVLKVLGP